MFRSMILGVLAGAAWWLSRGRTNRLQPGPVASLTAVGVGVALLVDVVVRLMVGGTSAFRFPRPDELARWLVDARFVLPLLLGIGAVIILAFALPTHASRGSASLARRTPFSFGQGWWFIARPAVAVDHVKDVQLRGLRTRNILAVLSGALLIHLGGILTSLAGNASFNGGVATGDGGWVVFGTRFAALEPALSLAGVAVTALGYALWVGVLLTARPLRRRVRALVRA